MDLSVDREMCIASGTCVRIAPELFTQDGDGRVVLREGRPAGASVRGAEEAVLACPAAAIDSAG